MNYTYDPKLPRGNFHVVHNGSCTSVKSHKDEEAAKEDAAVRNQKAKDLGLSCTYSVQPVTDGLAADRLEK